MESVIENFKENKALQPRGVCPEQQQLLLLHANVICDNLNCHFNCSGREALIAMIIPVYISSDSPATRGNTIRSAGINFIFKR